MVAAVEVDCGDVAVVLVLFGASSIPKFARSLGKAKQEFKKGLEEGSKESEKDTGQIDEKKT